MSFHVMEQCPEPMTTLQDEVIKVCMRPSQEGQVRQLLVAYADVFSSSETDVGRSNIVEHDVPVD